MIKIIGFVVLVLVVLMLKSTVQMRMVYGLGILVLLYMAATNKKK